MGIRQELKELFNKIDNYTVEITLKESCKINNQYKTKFKGEDIMIDSKRLCFNAPVSTTTAESILEMVEENDIETIKII